MRGIGGCILLLLAGCGLDDDASRTTASDLVDLTMNVATTRSDGAPSATDGLPEAEKIHTLRIIIIDATDGIEHNTLIYDNPTTGVEEVAAKTFKVKKNSSKTIYLLANAEQLEGLDLTNPEGLKERLDEYDRISLEYLRQAKALPMSSTYSFNVQERNKDCGTLYVAYAATKFSFTFRNEMQDGKALGVSGITVNQIASTSYLYPHGADKWLTDLLNKTVVSAYDIPATATHAPFQMEEFERVTIAAGTSYSFPPLYLTESKNPNGLDQKQSYSLGLKIGAGSDASGDHVRDVELIDGTRPLSSLFRSTHVNVEIVVKSLEQIEVITGIYGMIEPWGELDPVPGTIVEI